jgi:hypothetical protein
MFQVLHYKVDLSEEIVRWVFELEILKSTSRLVLFTNPTAGPWKRVVVKTDKVEYELFRFGRDEERPDVIALCDARRLLLIIEAKERVEQFNADVIRKTFELTRRFKELFANYDKHEDWLSRREYTVQAGFLFGAHGDAEATKAAATLKRHIGELGFPERQAYICAAVPILHRIYLREFGSQVRLFGALEKG